MNAEPRPGYTVAVSHLDFEQESFGLELSEKDRLNVLAAANFLIGSTWCAADRDGASAYAGAEFAMCSCSLAKMMVAKLLGITTDKTDESIQKLRNGQTDKNWTAIVNAARSLVTYAENEAANACRDWAYEQQLRFAGIVLGVTSLHYYMVVGTMIRHRKGTT